MKEQIVYEEDFAITLTESSREKVFHLLNCSKNSPIYEDMLSEYEEIEEEALSLLCCQGVASFSVLVEDMAHLKKGEEVLCSIFTIGKEISKKGQEYFDQGDYVKGMILDAIADVCIFQGEELFLERLKAACGKRNFGISGRFEAPNHVPMDFQRFAFEETMAERYLSMELSSGLMLNPVKSSCQCFSLSQNVGEFQVKHQCNTCSNVYCTLRTAPPFAVTMRERNATAWETVLCLEKQSLLDILREKHLVAPCGGNGICGKCQVEIVSGKMGISQSDQKFFNETELAEGYRLACSGFPESPCTILYENEQVFMEQDGANGSGKSIAPSQGNSLQIAIDLGSTTLAFALMEGDIQLNLISYHNPQRSFGSDVVSRIQSSNEGHGKALQECIQGALRDGIAELLQSGEISLTQVDTVVISGNTTMIHLLLGYSCESLGRSPFTPVDISLQTLSLGDVLAQTELKDISAVLLPSVSTFVGGDIVSGIFATEMYLQEKNCLLVDLGTNGEMVCGNSSGFLVTSTALGPACEGGNVTWGMTATKGAITSVEIHKGENQQVSYETIAGGSPVGICGSGVLEAISQMLEAEIIDETGKMCDEFRKDGFPLAYTEEGKGIVVTQEDVREIQLMKAAVRAGLETLIHRKKLSYEDIFTVYVAGGFGFHLNFRKIKALGLFPEAFQEKLQMVGNTSLQGAQQYREADSPEVFKAIVAQCEELHLATDGFFQEKYIDYMSFEEDEQ